MAGIPATMYLLSGYFYDEFSPLQVFETLDEAKQMADRLVTDVALRKELYGSTLVSGFIVHKIESGIVRTAFTAEFYEVAVPEELRNEFEC